MSTYGWRVLVLAAIVAGVWFFRVVAMPLALGLFLALCLAPLAHRVRVAVPKRLAFLGVLVPVLVLVATLAALVALVWLTLSFVEIDVERYSESLSSGLDELKHWLEERGIDGDSVAMDRLAENVSLNQVATGGLTSIAGIGTLLVLTFIFFVFMIGDAPRWRQRLQRLDRGRFDLTGLAETLSMRLRRYLAVMTVASLISGVAMAALLFLLDVRLALAIGLLTFLMSYLPTIGSIIAVVPAVLVAWIDQGFAKALVVLALATVLEQITGNWLAPKLEGRALKVSPLAVLVSLVFWGFLWGIVGALLAVPILLAVVTIAEHVPSLRPIAILCGADDNGS